MTHHQAAPSSENELDQDIAHSLKIISSTLPDEWEKICKHYTSNIHQMVSDKVEHNKIDLAQYFYDHMMDDSSASFFLSDQLVKTKLHQTLQNWLSMVFAAPIKNNYEEVVDYQKKIGGIHSHIGIPTHLVLRGIRALNQGIFDILSDQDPHQQCIAMRYVTAVMTLTMEIMSRAYSTYQERNSRAEESYRLFAVSQNVASEKERQRATLLDWENQLMFELTINNHRELLPKLSQSDFGLWFSHKASHIFEGSLDVQRMQEYILSIDAMIDTLSHRNFSQENINTLVSIRDKSKSLALLLNNLFEQESALESGRDTLTNLLNRKHLHVIMTREISFARKNRTGLAVLAADIDFFKKINDTYGHDAGDFALQSVANSMTNAIRSSDFIFRTGGEEFIIVLPDINLEKATLIAEKLRKKIEQEKIVMSDTVQFDLTISIGMAMHNGHPDYKRLLKAADIALYDAKHTGRNKVSSYVPAMQETA